MKKLLLLSLAMTFGLFAVAQKIGIIPNELKNISAKKTMNYAVDIPLNLSGAVNPYVKPQGSKLPDEIEIGQTQYDLQSNQAVQNRIYLHPDGTIGGTFTYGTTSPNFAERGTGYNYFNNTSWGSNPTARVEATRCGWPSYSPFLGGELIVTHNGSTGLLITSRPTKGTGAWTTTTLVGPVTSGAGTALLWPRVITVDSVIHIIACTDQAATAGVNWYYEGLSLALVYYRSEDAGATWIGPTILPGMDSTTVVKNVNAIGYDGDSYSWAAPKGDTIAFSIGGSWLDFFAMKSFDGGDTWTKVMIYDFPDVLTAPTPIIAGVDGASAIAIDDLGKVHVVTGKMRYSDDAFGESPAASSWLPYTDGLLYWDEDMPEFDSALLNDNTQLIANGQYIAGMLDYSGNDTIDFPTVLSGEFPFGLYYLSLSSMPQIIIDESGDFYVTYASCREDLTNPGANPNEQLYRHTYAMKSLDGGATWCDVPTDLNDNVLHLYEECVFGSLSYTSDGKIHIVYQADEEPGLGIRGDEDPITTNYIYYLNIPKDEICQPIGIQETDLSTSVSIYPNPASDYTNVAINLGFSNNVQVNAYNIMGQNVFAKDYGTLSTGAHNLTINTSSFTSGIYFISVQAGDNKITRKIVVE